MQRTELVEIFNVTDHEGFNSADEMHRLVLEVVENLTDEEVVGRPSVFDRFLMSHNTQVLTKLDVLTSTNQVKELVCREGEWDGTSQLPHICQFSSFRVF